MTVHRDYFFDTIRSGLGSGSLNQEQVDGCNVFLDWYDAKNPPLPEKYHLDDRCLAYILATTWHETAFRMQPIIEGGGESYLKSKPYYPYYGRGYVQLTWKENYQAQDAKLGLDGKLVAEPDLALNSRIALAVIIEGMYDGDFTGKKLAHYFTDDLTDFYNARRIVNGTDCASKIANYATIFCNALSQT